MRSRRLSKPPCPPPTVSCVAPVLRARHACVCAVLRARHACVCAATTWFLETDASSPRSLLVVAFASEDETMFPGAIDLGHGGEQVMKLEQMKTVLEKGGKFEGINRKVQIKPTKWIEQADGVPEVPLILHACVSASPMRRAFHFSRHIAVRLLSRRSR